MCYRFSTIVYLARRCILAIFFITVWMAVVVRRLRLLLGAVVVALSASSALCACGAPSANGRELDDVIHAFNAYVSKLFVGQTEAVSIVRSELANL